MDLATQTHLHAVRQALVAELQALSRDIDTAAPSRRAEAPRDTGEVADPRNPAGRPTAAGMADQAERLDRAEAERVEAALRRLDQGTYGDCADCGEPIGWRRLQVMPAAPRCARCQAATERGADAAAGRHRR